MSSFIEKLDRKAPITVVISGACGQIAYNLIFLVARGDMLGADQPVILHLLDLPMFETKLGAVVMELEDCAFSTLVRVVATSSYDVAFAGVDVALLVGARPRGPGMERADLLQANAAIFRGQGEALGRLASRDVKVLVVGNPANTNALIAARAAAAGGLPASSFTALTRLDKNRARAALASRLGAPVAAISRVVIWGNHSTTQFPDARFALVDRGAAAGGPRPVPEAVGDAAWLEGPFVAAIQGRGKAVIDARGASSAASAAEAIVNHARDWLLGSLGAWVSMGVHTGDDAAAAPYGIAPGLIFSLPVTTQRGGRWAVVEGLPARGDAHGDALLRATEAELLHERDLAFAPPQEKL